MTGPVVTDPVRVEWRLDPGVGRRVPDPAEPVIEWREVAPGCWEAVCAVRWDGGTLCDWAAARFQAIYLPHGGNLSWVVSVRPGDDAPGQENACPTLWDAKVWAARTWRRVSS